MYTTCLSYVKRFLEFLLSIWADTSCANDEGKRAYPNSFNGADEGPSSLQRTRRHVRVRLFIRNSDLCSSNQLMYIQCITRVSKLKYQQCWYEVRNCLDIKAIPCYNVCV